MTILITGARLLAAHAAKALIEAGETVLFYDVAPSEPYLRLVLEDRPFKLQRGDVLDLPQLLHTISRHGVSGMVHTAAFLPETAKDRPFMATRVTVEGTVNTLEAHRIAALGRYVLCSTIGIYDMDGAVFFPRRARASLKAVSRTATERLSASALIRLILARSGAEILSQTALFTM